MPSKSDINGLQKRIEELELEVQQLKEKNTFQPIFEESPIGIFRTSLGGQFLKVNKSLCDILGYADSSELIKSISKIDKDVYVNPKDRIQILNDLIKSDDYVRFEVDFKRKNKQVFTGLMSLKMIKDSAGKAKFIEGTMEDVTRFNQIEKAHKASEALQKTLIDTMSDMVVISELNGKIEYVSPQIRLLTGGNDDKKILGTNLLDWIVVEQHERAKNNIDNILNDKSGDSEEHEMIRKDGSSFYAEIRTTVYKNEYNEAEKLISIIRDITYNKRIQQLLEETQNLYRKIIECSPEGIMILSEGIILFANSSMAQMLNIDNVMTMMGTDFRTHVSKSNVKGVNQLFKNVEGNKNYKETIQIQLISLEGEARDVSLLSSPITMNGDNCSFVMVDDITDRVRAEKELTRDKQLMDSFWHHTPDAITFKDLDGKFMKVNDEFIKWVNAKDESEIIGKTDKEIFNKNFFNYSKKEEKNVIGQGSMIVNDIRQERWPNGDDKWVMLTKMPLFDLDNNITGVFAFTRDITDVKQSEIEIRQSEERLRWIFDNSPVGKVITDDKLNVIQTNVAFRKLLGRNARDLQENQLNKFISVDSRKDFKQEIKNLKSSDLSSFQMEGQVVSSDNNDKYVLIQGVPLRDTQLRDKFLFQFIDIHSRKIAEDLLKTRNNELNNFVYKVSHDLRAPLTSIQGLIKLMEMESDPTVQEEYVQMMESRIERLDDFIRNVLSHSKNLNADVIIEEVDLEKIISEHVSQLTYNKNYKNVTCTVFVKGKKLYSDAQRMHEILRNIITNAFQYSRETRVEPFVKIDARITPRTCNIIIEDNGTGIRKKYQSKIFDMFYRANEKVEGSGLGLYIVKQTIEKLGGSISLESQVHVGTKIIIDIPNQRGTNNT